METDYFSGSNYSIRTADQAIRGGTRRNAGHHETTNRITDQRHPVKAMRAATYNISHGGQQRALRDGEPIRCWVEG